MGSSPVFIHRSSSPGAANRAAKENSGYPRVQLDPHGEEESAVDLPGTETARPVVLLVDDDGDQRVLFSSLLKHEGYRVVTASNAKAALHILRHRRVDLVVSDLFMPSVDGYNFIQQLRQKPGCKDIPVIVFTAVEDMENAEWQLLTAGADTFCSKRDTKLLLQQVRLLLQ